MTCSRPCSCVSGSSCSCGSQPGTSGTISEFRILKSELTHYRSPTPCDCGDTHHDPETGICLTCDPVLYRVVAYPDEWFSDDEMEAPSVLVGGRGLAATVERLARETRRSVDVSLA